MLSREPKYDMATAKLEAEMTMCGALSDLLDKTGGLGFSRPKGKLKCAAAEP